MGILREPLRGRGDFVGAIVYTKLATCQKDLYKPCAGLYMLYGRDNLNSFQNIQSLPLVNLLDNRCNNELKIDFLHNKLDK